MTIPPVSLGTSSRLPCINIDGMDLSAKGIFVPVLWCWKFRQHILASACAACESYKPKAEGEK